LIFKNKRIGKNGKTIYVYKYRSMCVNAEKVLEDLMEKDPKIKEEYLTNKKLENDPRITKVGKFIRKTSIDELPQLFNILKGDMSIVGPRPRLVKDLVFYREEVLAANTVRPGITGPAQVYDPGSQGTWESVFARDIEYANNVTFKNDLKLFFGTFAAVFKNRAASGAEENSKKREYYYPDQLLKDNEISKEQYDKGLELAKNLKVKQTIEYSPELREKENNPKDE